MSCVLLGVIGAIFFFPFLFFSPAAPSESDGVDELSGLTRIQEIGKNKEEETLGGSDLLDEVALLEREASCPTSERVAKWNKWR
jgi:hypothetical protein